MEFLPLYDSQSNMRITIRPALPYLKFAVITFTNDVQQQAERAIKVMVSFAFAGGLEPLGPEKLRYKPQFPCLSV